MSPASKPTPWIARVGLMVFVWLALGLLTGIPLFFGRRGWWDPVLHPLSLTAHIYVSVFSIPFLAAKIWGTWSLLRGAPRGREAPPFDRAASIVLIAFILVLYGSGVLLLWNVLAEGNAWLKDVHLYFTLASAAPLSWHLYRRLAQSWRAVQSLPSEPRPGGWDARLYSRRALLALAMAAGLSGLFRWAIPARAIEDPNDFPVTNFGPSAQTIDLKTWRLVIRGDVSNSLSLSIEELLRMPRERHRYSLDCITGWSATREWEGIPISYLLQLVQPSDPEVRLRFISTTGYDAVMLPQKYGRVGAMLATHVGGVPFTHDHGYPIRLMVPGVVGEENVKWLAEIEVFSIL
jgi:hypothetical protein